MRALRGHPVVVNVWAAWCVPVPRRAARHPARVAGLGQARGLPRRRPARQPRARPRSCCADIPLTYPSYEDPDGKVANGYRLVGTPSTIYYDAAGKQTYVHQGPYLDRAQLDADIKRYATS